MAESDWKRKHDEGYKSRHDLKIDISGDLMHYSVNHVRYKTLTEALEATLPQFNTDAAGNVFACVSTFSGVQIATPGCYQTNLLGGSDGFLVSNNIPQFISEFKKGGKINKSFRWTVDANSYPVISEANVLYYDVINYLTIGTYSINKSAGDSGDSFVATGSISPIPTTESLVGLTPCNFV
jgi:hypothetical protein